MTSLSYIQPERAAALLLRLTLGIVALAHAGLKVFVFGLPGTIAYFQSVGFPGWLAWVVVAVEAAAGAMLVLGVASRVAAAALAPIMLGALFVHAGNGWVFNAPGGGWEYPAVLLILAAVVSLLGDGAAALRPVPHTATARHA